MNYLSKWKAKDRYNIYSSSNLVPARNSVSVLLHRFDRMPSRQHESREIAILFTSVRGTRGYTIHTHSRFMYCSFEVFEGYTPNET